MVSFHEENKEIAQSITDMETALARREALTKKNAEVFKQKYGSVDQFVQGRVVDLTDMLRKGDPKNPEPLVKSFYELSERLFPVEGERETPKGFKAYVQPTKPENLKEFPNSERRIQGIVDDNNKIIAAIVYGVDQTPAKLRRETGVDGTVGITYAMVDENYRGVGLGRYLVQEVIPRTAKDILSTPTIPRLLGGAEVNDITKLTVKEALSDITGAETMPAARQTFWNKQGFFPTTFDDYSQIKLREELSAFSALRFHVSGWDREKEMPSELLWRLVKQHAVLCLNKQEGLDVDDRSQLRRMQRGIMQGPTVDVLPGVEDYRAKDANLVAALKRATSHDENIGDMLIADVLRRFGKTEEPKPADRAHLTAKDTGEKPRIA